MNIPIFTSGYSFVGFYPGSTTQNEAAHNEASDKLEKEMLELEELDKLKLKSSTKKQNTAFSCAIGGIIYIILYRIYLLPFWDL